LRAVVGHGTIRPFHRVEALHVFLRRRHEAFTFLLIPGCCWCCSDRSAGIPRACGRRSCGTGLALAWSSSLRAPSSMPSISRL
jgi:hypothetical protein